MCTIEELPIGTSKRTRLDVEHKWIQYYRSLGMNVCNKIRDLPRNIYKHGNRYRVQINSNTYVGSFTTLKEAKKALKGYRNG